MPETDKPTEAYTQDNKAQDISFYENLDRSGNPESPQDRISNKEDKKKAAIVNGIKQILENLDVE